jgi:hypothetical protein
MPLAGAGIAKIGIDFESRVNELIADSKRVIDQQEKLKKEFKETNAAIKKSAEEADRAAKNSKMSWTDFRSMYSTVLDVVRVGQAVWEETGQKYVDNAVLVGNLARAMGTTTEEASRLKEVADDVGVSTDSLRTSLKLALKDGFEPSIDGLARMSDEYLNLAPGTERMQFLLDRFGKSGEEMGKLLEKGGDSIRNMSDAMDEGLIVTEQAYEEARQYQISADALKDSWDALTYKAAPPLVNALTNIINAQRDATRAQEMAAEQREKDISLEKNLSEYRELAKAEREAADGALLAKDAAEGAGGAFETEAEAVARLADEAKIAEQAIKDMTKANQDELKTLGDLTKTIDSYRDKQADLTEKQVELLAEKEKLIDQGWSEEGEKIQEVNDKLAENAAAQQENADAFQLATNQRILARAEELVSIDGLTTEEKNGLIERGIAMGVYTAEAAVRMKEEESAANDLANSLMSIPAQVQTLVTTTFQTIGSPPVLQQGAGGAGSVKVPGSGRPHASGGSFMVPQSYGNEGFMMGNGDTASGGELISISPKGQGAGMTFVVNLNGSFADPEEQAREFTSIVKRILRNEGVVHA